MNKIAWVAYLMSAGYTSPMTGAGVKKLIKDPTVSGSFWFDFCFMVLQNILGHFGRGQLT